MMTCPELFDLAARTSDRVLVAFAAGLRVEDRAEAVADSLDFFKLATIHAESGLVGKAVWLIVVPGWSLSGSAGVLP